MTGTNDGRPLSLEINKRKALEEFSQNINSKRTRYRRGNMSAEEVQLENAEIAIRLPPRQARSTHS